MPKPPGETLCISIAARPGKFGTALFTAAFAKMKMNWRYEARKVLPAGLARAVARLRTEKIRGSGVTMPHKAKVIALLDSVDRAAKKIGAVNTIVNSGGKLRGYNTDCIGAKKAISERMNMKGKTALLIGTGGAASAIAYALHSLGVKKIFVADRKKKKAVSFCKKFNATPISLQHAQSFHADLLINATPVGMKPDENGIILPPQSLCNFSAVMDVVISPINTRLMRTAAKMGRKTIPGYRMALYQAAAQFELYTKKKAPVATMERAMKKLLK